MGKILSDRERRLQKKLIPVNLVVCIICLIAAASLFIMPFLKINVGKILRNEGTVSFIEDKVDGMVGGKLEDSGNDTVDYAPVVAVLVKNVLGNAKGEISLSAFDAFKVATAKKDKKAEMVLNQLFYGEKGIVNDLIESVADGVVHLFDTDEGKTLIEQAVVSVVAKSFAAGLPEEAAAKINGQTLPGLTEKFKKLGEAQNSEEAAATANAFVDALKEVFGDSYTGMDENREAVVGYLVDIYGSTVDALAGGQTSAEALISVAVSQNVDLAKFNLEELLGGFIKDKNTGEEEGGEEQTQSPARFILAEDPTEGEGTEEGGDASDRVICTSYNEILAAMGLDSQKLDELKDSLKSAIRSAIDKATEPYEKYIAYYGYVFYGMLVFIVPWLILFLFSFFHMMAKNKRFSMWYVKLYSFLPCALFFLAPKLAPILLDKFAPNLLGDKAALVNAALSGISSYTWISGICYLVLWLVSIFWAFPIKHKIRKERKACKKAMKSGNYPPAPEYGAPAPSYGDSYGGAYGGYGDNYGSSYGDGYGADYGGFNDTYDGDLNDLSSYGYGDDYGSYGSLYDDAYGSYKSPFDDDDDY